VVGSEIVSTKAGVFLAQKIQIDENITVRNGGSAQGISFLWMAPGQCSLIKSAYSNGFGDRWTHELNDQTDSDPPAITGVEVRPGARCRYAFDHNGTYATWDLDGISTSGGNSESKWTKESDNTTIQQLLDSNNSAWSKTIDPVNGTLLTTSPSYQWAVFPLFQGVTWNGETVMQGSTSSGIFNNRVQYTGNAVRWEDVTMTAGSFRALRMEHTETFTPVAGGTTQSGSYTQWFAPASDCAIVDFQYANDLGQHARKELLSP
jgi:hypothetical protein